MAETLLSFGLQKLWDLLVTETERFQGVDEQFDELKSDLNMLRCFLEDADAKKHTSAMVKNSVEEIKEIVYDAEDIIQTFLLTQKLTPKSNMRKRFERCACVVVERRGVAFDIQSLSKRISKVIRDMQSLGVQQVIVNDRVLESLHEKQREMRKTFSSDNENDLVGLGLEENVAKLVSVLVKEDMSQVVSISGMGGIGKTTLARQVFNHEMVKRCFDGVAWVCVSQQFTRKYVWRTILRSLKPNHEDMTEDELQSKLFGLLETQKCLIVIDDIWKEEDWDIIKPMFPRNHSLKFIFVYLSFARPQIIV